ncbi:MAG: thermonuclease family protein [Acidobacteria bacterium]|nr:thermonuclease family protein [Acidobacteriota bacterium]
MHRIFWLIALVLLVFTLTFAQIDPWKNRTVISVIDGDTVVLDNGEVAKLIGLSSPHAKHGKQEGQVFGEQSRILTEELLLGRKIEVGFDIAYGSSGHRDQFGRALIYVTVAKGIEKSIANIELLKQGAGFYLPAEKELQIGAALKSAETDARKRKAGVWAATDKSPIEIAEAEGKVFQETASLNLIFIRPTVPIIQGPGVTSEVAINKTPTPTTPTKSAAMDMEDLRLRNPNGPKKEEPKKANPADNGNSIYDLATRAVFFSTFDGEQKLELYKAVTRDNDTTYRISVKQNSKEVVFITNANGLKEIDKLLSKGTESQPTLSSIQSTIGGFSGQYGTNVVISTGKDGGLVLNLTGKDGTIKFYLNRQNAQKMQIAIGNV